MVNKVVTTVLSGAMVFVGMPGTDAVKAIPTNLRAQFEKFLAETKNAPIPADLQAQFKRFMIERSIAKFPNEREKANTQSVAANPPTTVVANHVQPEPNFDPLPKGLIRLAAAGSPDMDSQIPALTMAVRPLVPAKPDCVLPVSTSPEPPTGTGKHFEIGDKLKLAFFENIQDVEKNKWGNAAGNGFQQHPELSGDYPVQDDGTISVPVLGQFNVLDLTPKELQTQMAEAFDNVIGRKGFVTILSIERPPIYVLGPVKNPGSYTYSPGMTVLHAVTLAGGFPRQDTPEPWQKMEKVRETTKRYGTLELLSELLTRRTVLKAERDHTKPIPPQQLFDLVGPTKATALIAAEIDRQSAIVSARNARLQSAAEGVKAAQQDVDLLSNQSRSIESIDANIAALKRRAAGVEQLYNKGALNNNLLIETKSRVADAERNRQDMIIQLAQAKQRLVTAQQDQAKLEADRRGELDTQILSISQQIADANRETATSEGILGALQVQYTLPASAITYEIVRQTTKGPVAFAANGMSTLIPGDLVQVSTTDGEKAGPSATTPGQPNIRPTTTPASAAAGCR
jgi:protein involved in polysaccharide export with SLBB domain